MKLKRLVLHIGMPKCGSTSIQNSINNNNELLLSHGILIPEKLNFNKSWVISAACAGEKGQHYFTNTLRVIAENNFDLLNVELDNIMIENQTIMKQEGCHTMIVSSEYLYGICKTSEEISKIYRYLNPYFKKIDIIFVCREPEYVLNSNYAQFIQGPAMGMLTFDAYINLNREDVLYDYKLQLAKWEEVFQDASVNIIDLSSLKNNQSLIIDFFKHLNFDQVNQLNLNQKQSNKSYGYGNLKLLATINSWLFKSKLKPNFNSLPMKIIRNIVRLVPMQKKFPKTRDVFRKDMYNDFLNKFKIS